MIVGVPRFRSLPTAMQPNCSGGEAGGNHAAGSKARKVPLRVEAGKRR